MQEELRREIIFPMDYPQPGGLRIDTPMPKRKVFGAGGGGWEGNETVSLLLRKRQRKLEELG